MAGGGTAPINAIPAVRELCDTLEGDERTGARIVLKALEAPLRQIAYTAGLEGSVIIDKIINANKPNYGLTNLTRFYDIFHRPRSLSLRTTSNAYPESLYLTPTPP